MADEVRAGMEAYCLTVYEGAKIEKFGLEVLDVVRNFEPGRDLILVKGTDERFIHTGPVAGCSGSPVYIEGRLAGALAMGWTYSKDPLYGVTPIAEMHRVGESGGGAPVAGYSFDYSRPVDFERSEREMSGFRPVSGKASGGMGRLPCPVVTSGLGDWGSEQLADSLGPLGFSVVTGAAGGGAGEAAGENEFVPGSCLMVPLAMGDIAIDVIGTVTDVSGDDVYGFGHSFLGYGDVDLPMAAGQVHTVVSSLVRSFKFATSGELVGALRVDGATAVCGKLGVQARMIPVRIGVDRYNDSQKHYECRIADNELLTPLLARAVVTGAVLVAGDLPPENTLEYSGSVRTADGKEIQFDNVATDESMMDLVRDSIQPVALLMSNPYKKAAIEGMDIDVRVRAENISAAIWSVDLSDTAVKAGERVKVDVVVENYLAQKSRYAFEVKVPDELEPGQYELMVCGGGDYQSFLKQAMPHRFMAESYGSLVEALNTALSVRRDGLYCVLVMPQEGGVAVSRAELSDLPGTRALVLADAKRATRVAGFPGWRQWKQETGTIVVNRQVMRITVEE
jgi:hypothetical protein